VGAELIIFDCDGVLVDSEMIGCRVEAEVFTAAGFPIEAEEIRRRFIGISFKDQIATLERERGWRVPEPLIQRVREAITAAHGRELTAIAGVADALTAIAQPVCVASSSLPERIRHSLGLVGLVDRFHPNLFSSAMVERGKPAPDLFLHAARAMGAEPKSCVVVEDSVYGVTAARAAGMRAFGFAGASHCRAGHGALLAEAGAHRVFEDMRRLPALLQSEP
jgi:HAD superfamily hydrolase (TIGR01509 family)